MTNTGMTNTGTNTEDIGKLNFNKKSDNKDATPSRAGVCPPNTNYFCKTVLMRMLA